MGLSIDFAGPIIASICWFPGSSSRDSDTRLLGKMQPLLSIHCPSFPYLARSHARGVKGFKRVLPGALCHYYHHYFNQNRPRRPYVNRLEPLFLSLWEKRTMVERGETGSSEIQITQIPPTPVHPSIAGTGWDLASAPRSHHPLTKFQTLFPTVSRKVNRCYPQKPAQARHRAETKPFELMVSSLFSARRGSAVWCGGQTYSSGSRAGYKVFSHHDGGGV